MYKRIDWTVLFYFVSTFQRLYTFRVFPMCSKAFLQWHVQRLIVWLSSFNILRFEIQLVFIVSYISQVLNRFDLYFVICTMCLCSNNDPMKIFFCFSFELFCILWIRNVNWSFLFLAVQSLNKGNLKFSIKSVLFSRGWNIVVKYIYWTLI